MPKKSTCTSSIQEPKSPNPKTDDLTRTSLICHIIGFMLVVYMFIDGMYSIFKNLITYGIK